MRHAYPVVLAQLTLCLSFMQGAAVAQESPAWAYPVNPPDFKLSPDDGSMRRVPDSAQRYSTPQVRDRFFAPDWHPADHPPMPTVVSVGRKPDVSACAYCHRAEGTGGPENASLAGLPAAYVVQQLADFKAGTRSTAVPKRAPQALMIAGAKAASDDEVLEAARYFSQLKPRKTIRVVESETVPKTFIAGWFFARNDSAETEPLGQRIMEIPDQLEEFESRDSHTTFTAYVTPGRLARGRALVTGQDLARAPACATCHGKDLHGMEAIPSIAGRSPTYVFRQLHEIQTGVRRGAKVQPMTETVAKLTQDDMMSIAAYLATLDP